MVAVLNKARNIESQGQGLNQASHTVQKLNTRHNKHAEIVVANILTNDSTNAAAEIFQYTLQAQLQGLKSVKKKHSRRHNRIPYNSRRTRRKPKQCLIRLFDRGLRLNRLKCKFLNEFFGWIFSKDGYKPDPKRYTRIEKCTKTDQRV